MPPNPTRLAGFKVLSVFISSENYDRVERVYRTSSRMYGLLRKTAPKANPALAFVDAAASLIDLVSSYCKYQQAVEKTKQLEVRNDALRKEIENIKRILEIEESTELKKHSLQAEARIGQMTQNLETLKHIGGLLHEVSADLQYFRAQGVGSRDTHRKLEKQFFNTNILYLQIVESVV